MPRHNRSQKTAVAARPAFAARLAELERLARDAFGKKRYQEASAHFMRALRMAPTSLPLLRSHGASLANSGDIEAAIGSYTKALAIAPGHFDTLSDLARLEIKLQRWSSAITHLQRAIDAGGSSGQTFALLGRALAASGAQRDALIALQEALTRDPDNGALCLQVGREMEGLDLGLAAVVLDRAILLLPTSAQAHFSRAAVAYAQGDVREATRNAVTALDHDPDFAKAYCLLAQIELDGNNRSNACALLEREIACSSDNAEAVANLLHEAARIGDWERIARFADRIPGLGIETSAVHPFALLGFDDDPERGARRIAAYVRRFPTPPQNVSFPRPKARPARLRVGYFSNDFFGHATMFLMGRMFEILDRERFEPILLSYGTSLPDDMFRRLKNSGIAIHDISSLRDHGAISYVHRMGLDIAIDLKGHTKGSRLSMFATRLAPVQISYLGFPATTGLATIDYAVADAIALPPDDRAHWSEKIIYMPHSYQVTDNTRPIGAIPRRAHEGLPEDAFVFASFNHSFKITPMEFSIWARLLRRVPQSVLWLFSPFEECEANMRANVAAFGMDPDRVIFAKPLDQTRHMARLPLADLFLDSFTCNAHTTASDALWAGVPVLTCPGSAFHSRVAASLCISAGLPELVAENPQHYEEMAVAIATNKDLETALKTQLISQRPVCPLFDTERFVANFERALDLSYDRFLAGLAPDHLFVTE